MYSSGFFVVQLFDNHVYNKYLEAATGDIL